MKQAQDRNTLEKTYASKYEGARYCLLLIVILTVVNVVITLTGSDSYFLFSAFIPFIAVFICALETGAMPDEYYEYPKETLEFLPKTVLYAAVGFAIICVAAYLACWLFSKAFKSTGLIVGILLFGIDTVVKFLFGGISADMIIDYVMAAYIIFKLVSGISAARKLKALPPPEIAEVPTDDFSFAERDFTYSDSANDEKSDENK